jgi:hypothetical protein
MQNMYWEKLSGYAIVGILELHQDLFVLSQLAFSASTIRLTNPSQAWTYATASPQANKEPGSPSLYSTSARLPVHSAAEASDLAPFAPPHST